MSFWSAVGGGLKKGLKVADKVIDLVPEQYQDKIGALVPGPFGAILKLIFTLEDLSEPQAKGAERKAALLAVLRLRYPKLDPAKIDPLIDKQLEVLNGIAAAVDEAEKK